MVLVKPVPLVLPVANKVICVPSGAIKTALRLASVESEISTVTVRSPTLKVPS